MITHQNVNIKQKINHPLIISCNREHVTYLLLDMRLLTTVGGVLSSLTSEKRILPFLMFAWGFKACFLEELVDLVMVLSTLLDSMLMDFQCLW